MSTARAVSETTSAARGSSSEVATSEAPAAEAATIDPACIQPLRHTELPGTSKLFADFCYDFAQVAGFYRYDPVQAGSLEAAAKAVEYPEERRAAMARALAAQAEANGETDPQTAALLKRFAEPGTVAILTGQQVGLFSGPAYTIYKALTAARLAEDLTRGGTPAVPVFWLATEDHDFDEVRHTWVFDTTREPVKIATGAAQGWESCQRPAGTYPVEQPPIDELRTTLRGFPHADEVVAAVEQSYHPGGTMGAGFRALLKRLLGKVGVLVVDPLDPAVRAIGAPFMAEALRKAPELKRALLERGAALSKAGYHSQVLVEEKTSLFFLLERGERQTLRQKDSECAALADRAASASPNALLRPVWQDYLFPTAAYVGGPGEIAYFAQSSVLYDQLLGRMPVIYPRACFTVTDARAEKLLTRFGLKLTDVLVLEEELRHRIARTLIPASLAASFDKATAEVTGKLDALGAEIAAFDPTLAEAMAKSRDKVEYQLQKIRRKTERETLLRDERASADAAYLTGLLYPEKHLQERLHSILPLLAQHGMDLVERLYAQVKTGSADHLVVEV